MLTLKAIIVSAPAALREKLEALRARWRWSVISPRLRPGPLTSPTASAKASLRALARRWLDLDAEIKGPRRSSRGNWSSNCAPDAGQGAWHQGRHRRGDADPRRRQPGADPLRGGAGQALRRLPDPRLERQGHRHGSTAAVTGRPMPPFTAWSSCACAATSPRSTTSGAARRRERASLRSFAVSSASWSGKSSAICAVQPNPLHLTKMPVDIYRSINAGLAHRADCARRLIRQGQAEGQADTKRSEAGSRRPGGSRCRVASGKRWCRCPRPSDTSQRSRP